MPGKIYLIPNLLGECDPEMVLPHGVVGVIHSIKHFVVESTRTARRFLIKTNHPLKPDDLHFYELNKHNPEEGISDYIQLCISGNDVGIISEAGVPGIADPGSLLARAGHINGVRVIPCTGPSSIFLALSASGLNGQNFVFHGYLPHNNTERHRKIKEMENNSVKSLCTQIFIETPFRNQRLLDELLRTCHLSTMLCIACDISTGKEFIKTRTIAQWKKNLPDINKRPSVFLLGH